MAGGSHGLVEWHGQEHCEGTGGDGGGSLETGMGGRVGLRGRLLISGEDGIVAGVTNDLDEGLRGSEGGVEGEVGSMAHEVNVCGEHTWGVGEGLFDVELAGGAAHAQNGEGESLGSCFGICGKGRGHRGSGVQAGRETGFCQCGEGSFRGGIVGSFKASRTDANFFNGVGASRGNCLGNAADATAAVHAIDMERDLSQGKTLPMLRILLPGWLNLLGPGWTMVWGGAIFRIRALWWGGAARSRRRGVGRWRIE